MNKEEIEELFFPKEFGKKLELNAYDYYKALLDIKEYITSEEYFDLNNRKTGSFSEDSKNYFLAHDKLLDIVNKALGDKENDKNRK